MQVGVTECTGFHVGAFHVDGKGRLVCSHGITRIVPIRDQCQSICHYPRNREMFSKLRLIAIVIAAGAVPYVISETELGRSAFTKITGALTSTGYAPESEQGDHAHYQVEGLRDTASERFRYNSALSEKLGAIESGDAPPSLVGPNVNDLREVLRFDISPEWVLNRFARVSTVLADLQLEGMRVPIVTGTQADDLAGTMTYYFDQSHQLQRITIHGFTGKTDKLANVMTEYYGLAPAPTLEAGVFTRRWNGKPFHFLRITHAPVVYSNAVHQKYTVFLELNQPNLVFGISDEAQRIVDSDRKTGRW